MRIKTKHIALIAAIVAVGCKTRSEVVSENISINKDHKTPNVILIFADDMGWGDASYNGRKDIYTPNIDEIANQGVTFTQGYVSASVCGPSRSGMLTGVYQQRFGAGENMSATGYPDLSKMRYAKAGIPASQSLFSEVLKDENYNTAAIGKWHVGIHPTLQPNSRGFDYYYGFLNGAHDYYEASNDFVKSKGKWPLFKNTEVVKDYDETYFTETFSKEAVNYINKVAKDKNPFFLYVAYNAVHHPWQVPQKYIDRVKHLSNSKDKQVFAAMLLAMDDGVGDMMQALKTHDIEDNTVVIFVSDNGSPRGQGLKPTKKDSQVKYADHKMSSPGSFRGFKGDTFEGGIRVPFIMKWPGEIMPDTSYDLPVSTLDLLPTIASYINADPNKQKGFKYDGVNILPYIKGEKGNERPHEIMYWRRDNDYAIRKGDWKLTWNNHSVGKLSKAKQGKLELFDLKADQEERFDLSKSHPEKVKELQHLFDLWDTKNPDSKLWNPPVNRKYNYK
ncbi:sulfatase-like hydrolase/transferase [Tamlana sp. 2201CG12-4]|uniref:sulfatase-like hydrolase/transferase n=1 Tax=Tamlana sp. 2201CG12-4 TaxID=3112582 RepID=UPI002DB7B5C2|nr:sulfatase-like hydrolase/transferase [Tamlana sp. 2201CG12-4]MEC3905724.1 sulfatase-like hydrolase/transferase [Tamlana sp. 2201CG12-4]